MKKITLENLDDLAIGSAILGSGGGGDPTYFYMMAKYEMEKSGPVSLMSLSELKPQDSIAPIGYFGAPLIEMERVPSGQEFILLIALLEKTLRKKLNVVMSSEIGGGCAFAPILVAAQLGLPVLDGDLMGRAFPEIQMTSCQLFANYPSSGYIADCLGNTAVVNGRNNTDLEKIGRQITVSMGSSSVFGYYPISASIAQQCIIPRSVSKAIAIGKTHREAKENGKDPLESILKLCKGLFIGSGKITDIDRSVSRGFLNGSVMIQNKREKMELIFQNEYLLAKLNEKVIASTPDILMLLEQDTGAPITSEALQYGLKVNLIALPAPEIWTTPAGLALVGPRYFGYEVDYQPIHKSKEKNYLSSGLS